MSRLQGKVAVVTGASKGIGAAIAQALAAEGASVVVNYAQDRAGAERVVANIKEQRGQAIAVRGDVSKTADVTALFEKSREAFGVLDILVNNAGIYGFAPLEEVTEQDFQRQFGTNVLGLILVTQQAARHFGPDGGSVINIGSVVSQVTPPNSVVYSATKSAVNAVTRVLAKELAPRNIRVNSINPGVVETEGFRAAGFSGSELEKQTVARTPLGRVGRPRDIAGIATFLATPESGWLTGEILYASGGFH
jgi:3-oxoacyl-[acyl-carrier protein] reductase